jgi:hypothetical protein
MLTTSLPLDTWVVVEPLTNNELRPISTHATQREAELAIGAMHRLGFDFTTLAGFWSRLRPAWDALCDSRDSTSVELRLRP